jgi:subtilase family serine protease
VQTGSTAKLTTIFERRLVMKPEKLLRFMVTVTLGLGLFGCRADLVVKSLTHSPAIPTTKDTTTITAVVKNKGIKAADPSTLAIQVGSDTTPATYPVPTLKPGETHTVQRKETLSVAQRYVVTATADYNKEVPELNEKNNKKTDIFRVVEPAK